MSYQPLASSDADASMTEEEIQAELEQIRAEIAQIQILKPDHPSTADAVQRSSTAGAEVEQQAPLSPQDREAGEAGGAFVGVSATEVSGAPQPDEHEHERKVAKSYKPPWRGTPKGSKQRLAGMGLVPTEENPHVFADVSELKEIWEVGWDKQEKQALLEVRKALGESGGSSDSTSDGSARERDDYWALVSAKLAKLGVRRTPLSCRMEGEQQEPVPESGPEPELEPEPEAEPEGNAAEKKEKKPKKLEKFKVGRIYFAETGNTVPYLIIPDNELGEDPKQIVKHMTEFMNDDDRITEKPNILFDVKAGNVENYLGWAEQIYSNPELARAWKWDKLHWETTAEGASPHDAVRAFGARMLGVFRDVVRGVVQSRGWFFFQAGRTAGHELIGDAIHSFGGILQNVVWVQFDSLKNPHLGGPAHEKLVAALKSKEHAEDVKPFRTRAPDAKKPRPYVYPSERQVRAHVRDGWRCGELLLNGWLAGSLSLALSLSLCCWHFLQLYVSLSDIQGDVKHPLTRKVMVTDDEHEEVVDIGGEKGWIHYMQQKLNPKDVSLHPRTTVRSWRRPLFCIPLQPYSPSPISSTASCPSPSFPASPSSS